MNEQALTEIIEQNKTQECVAFFQGMSESQRRRFAPLCIKLLKAAKQSDRSQVTAEAAVLATGAYSALKAVSWRVTREQDLAFALLSDRRPEWLAQWAEKLLGESYYWFHWTLVRRLVRAGLLPKPQSPNYVLAMISGLCGGRHHRDQSVEANLLADPELLDDEVWRLFEHEGGGENSLANWDNYCRDRSWSAALLNLTVAGRLSRQRLLSCSLDALERDFNHYRARWFATFHDSLEPSPAELREHAPRYLRLVGASAPNIASWALELVQRLSNEGVYDPTTLIAGLEPALTRRQKTVVKRVLGLLAVAAQSSPQAAHQAVQAAVTALGHEASDVQKAALDLIDANAAAVDAEVAAALANYVPAIAASLRTRMRRWTGNGDEQTADSKKTITKKAAPTKTRQSAELPSLSAQHKKQLGIDALLANIEAARAEIPAATFDGTDIARLKRLQRLKPITDLDELIDVCAAVVEEDERVDDAERAFDGISRLCNDKPDDFARRVGPLAKRVTHRLQKDAPPFLGIGPGDDLCGVIYAWTTGDVIQWKKHPDPKRSSIMVLTIAGEQRSCFAKNLEKGLGFLSRRSIALAKRAAAGRAAMLLSVPTHAGGWIAPADLVERVNNWSGDEPDRTDVCLAMLRLAPDGRTEALKTLRDVQSEWGLAVRYALGAAAITPGQTAALWIAAARARAPWADDEQVEQAFPNRGPDAGLAAKYSVSFATQHNHTDIRVQSDPPTPNSIDPDCVTTILHAQRGAGRDLQWEMGGPGGRTTSSVRWTATIWPQARDSMFAAALETIADNLDWWEATWQNKALLEPLLDSGTPLRSMGLMLLAVGLAAKEPGEYGLAIDIAIGAIQDGRLGSDNLGQVLAQLLPTGLIKPARWQKTLADVARVSPVHGLVVQQALQTTFRGSPEQMPRNFATLLELLFEVSHELNQHIDDEACRAFLRQLTSGKASTLAKELLSLPATDFAQSARPILTQAIQQRAAAFS